MKADGRERFFQLRDKVYWNTEDRPSVVGERMSQYGSGPFWVVGLRLQDQAAIAQGQFPVAVTIELPSGVRQEFDGGWFQREC